MKGIGRKCVFICIVMIAAFFVLTLGLEDKMREVRIEKQWSGQSILFCNKIKELLEPALDFTSDEELFGYFESEEVEDKLAELERLYFMKREFVENNDVLSEKWETDNLGMVFLIRYKEYRTMRYNNGGNGLDTKEFRSLRTDYEYFDTMIDDIMSGRTAMKVPSSKYIEEAQESLNTYIMTEEGLSRDDLEEFLPWKMNPSLVK